MDSEDTPFSNDISFTHDDFYFTNFPLVAVHLLYVFITNSLSLGSFVPSLHSPTHPLLHLDFNWRPSRPF